jgi:hypothetical protein
MEVVSKNVHWLLPEEPCPCDIFLYFRGQYAPALTAGNVIGFSLLEKLSKAQCAHVYIRRADESVWASWVARRYPIPRESAAQATEEREATGKVLYGNKRAELLSYVQKCVTKKLEGDKELDLAFEKALAMLQKIIKLPTLDWYFQRFHEPPVLFHHCGRVAYALAIFLQLHKLTTDAEAEAICYSALIHELEGDLDENVKAVVSRQTLEQLQKNQHPVPREVLEYIDLHDELCSGKGFPNNKKTIEIPVPVRIFSLFNHFDAYRARNSGTRRARMEKTKSTMYARKSDFDSAVWPMFWDFWERQLEAVT